MQSLKRGDVERSQRAQSKPLTESFKRDGVKCRDNYYRSWWGTISISTEMVKNVFGVIKVFALN